MGKTKKEKNRIAREQIKKGGNGQVKGGGGGAGNLKVKGENFYRDAKKVKFMNMVKSGKAIRNAKGKIVKEAPFQSKKAVTGRVQPNRKWFG